MSVQNTRRFNIEVTSTQDQTRLAQNKLLEQKMIDWKRQRLQKLRRFEVERTSKNPREELIDISSILKVESTQNFPRRIGRTFHVEIRGRVDGELTKMCPLGSSHISAPSKLPIVTSKQQSVDFFFLVLVSKNSNYYRQWFIMRRSFLQMFVCCFANLSVWCRMFSVIDR